MGIMMELTSALSEATFATTTASPSMSTGSSQSYSGMAADMGMGSSEFSGVSCVGTTITGSVDASSGGPVIGWIIAFFPDTTPYSRTEHRASHLYQHLKGTSSETDFPVVICENEDVASAMQSVFGTCERGEMVEKLTLLETMIGGDYND